MDHPQTGDITKHPLPCKTATNVKEATQLIESGFEYVCNMESVKLFRKRK